MLGDAWSGSDELVLPKPWMRFYSIHMSLWHDQTGCRNIACNSMTASFAAWQMGSSLAHAVGYAAFANMHASIPSMLA